MKDRINKYLFDALEASKSIVDFTKDVSANDYFKDEMLQSAVERKFEIIGESLNRIRHIDHEFVIANITDAEKIIGFRNILIHGYDLVENELVWNAIKKHLPRLIRQLEKLIERK